MARDTGVSLAQLVREAQRRGWIPAREPMPNFAIAA